MMGVRVFAPIKGVQVSIQLLYQPLFDNVQETWAEFVPPSSLLGFLWSFEAKAPLLSLVKSSLRGLVATGA